MDGFGLICTSISMLMLLIFNIISIRRYGLLSCYSAYGEKWEEYGKEVGIKNLNLWTTITNVSAVLLVPPMLVASEGTVLQSVCFFAPLYLIMVGATPDYAYFKNHKTIHVCGVLLCVVSLIIWLSFISGKIIILWPVSILLLTVALGTNTLKESWLYYLEMTLYITAYVALLTY